MTIGNQPISETLVLVPGQDFMHEISMPTGATVPDGTTVDLIIYALDDSILATWPANISSTAVSWEVQSTDSDQITSAGRFRIYVHYSDGRDVCWFSGRMRHE